MKGSERAEIEALGEVVLHEYQRTTTLESLAPGDRAFCACEERGLLARSFDGTTWLPTREGLRAFYEHFEERTWEEIE